MFYLNFVVVENLWFAKYLTFPQGPSDPGMGMLIVSYMYIHIRDTFGLWNAACYSQY